MTTMQGGNQLMVYSAKEFDFSKMSVPEHIQLVQDLGTAFMTKCRRFA